MRMISSKIALSLTTPLGNKVSGICRDTAERREEESMSAYLSEIRTNWRPLLAAFIGMGSGMSVVGVITSTISGN